LQSSGEIAKRIGEIVVNSVENRAAVR